MHSRIERESKSREVWDIRIAGNFGAPLRTIPDFAGVVVVAVSVVQPARGHHATVVEFGDGRVPASVGCGSHVHKRFRARIENRSIGQAGERNFPLNTDYFEGSVSFGS